MKTLALLLFLTIPSFSQPENLTQADKETLLEQLEAIRNAADARVDQRFRTALTAFSAAMASEDTAYELYLQCQELVNFEEKKKSAAEFREWKKKNDDKITDKHFKTALRQQLGWLVLTLQAASDDPDREKLAKDAGRILDSIVSQAEDLAPFSSTLLEDVTGSVFGQAYEIKGLKVETWPMAPAQLEAIYNDIILPPLRSIDRLPALRSAWTKRMVQESVLVDFWGGRPVQKPQNENNKGNGKAKEENRPERRKPGEHSPAYEKFVTETLPNIQWTAEIDQYKAGDQRAAALRMLEHIQKNLAHDSAPKWAEAFAALLMQQPPASPGDLESPLEPSDLEAAPQPGTEIAAP